MKTVDIVRLESSKTFLVVSLHLLGFDPMIFFMHIKLPRRVQNVCVVFWNPESLYFSNLRSSKGVCFGLTNIFDM